MLKDKLALQINALLEGLEQAIREEVKAEIAKEKSAQVFSPVQLRISKGCERNKLAFAVGTSDSTLRRLETGKTQNPNIGLCNKIADELKLDREVYRQSVVLKVKGS